MKTFIVLFALITAGSGLNLPLSAAPATLVTNEVIFADFEGDNWGGWTPSGDAFGRAPARGAWEKQQPVTGFLGNGFVNTFVGGDKSTGTLTSPEFTIALPYLNFLIGGGNHPGEVCINLIIDGKVARSSTGSEFERLHWHTWNLFQFLRKKARLEIVDKHTGGWGHINLDQITFSDRPKVHPYFNDPVTHAMTSPWTLVVAQPEKT